MKDLYLWDDAVARQFEPFAHTRPVSELRAGAWLLRERWERAAGVAAAGLVTSHHLRDFMEAGTPPVHEGELPAGAVVANARCAIGASTSLHEAAAGQAWKVNGRVAAICLTRPCMPDELPGAFAAASAADAAAAAAGDAAGDAAGHDAGHDAGHAAADDATRLVGAEPLAGRWLDAVWELVSSLPELLLDDLLTLAMERHETLVRPTEANIIGDHPVLAAWDVRIEPHVVIDARSGPVILLDGSEVFAFTRLCGPLLLGPHAMVVGGDVRGCSIGEWSKVHGEMSSSIVLSHSNKSHDGFVGHSYLGKWVNLGAGTTTSNLKNTYGTVGLWTPEGIRNTGLQFLGTFFGDHAKTGIGLMLTTGCVIGAGVNVYGSMPPKVVSPFAWGGQPPYSLYDEQKFLDVCGRAMERRHVALDGNGRRHLAALFAARWEAAQS